MQKHLPTPVAYLASLLLLVLAPMVVAADSGLYAGWEPGAAHDVDRRLEGWVSRGADLESLHRVIAETDGLFGEGPGTWAYEQNALGQHYRDQAGEALAAGDKQSAAEHLRTASTHFGLARYPFIHSEEARAAYGRHNETYYEYLALTGVQVEHIRIPFQGKEIIGNYYLPETEADGAGYPLVVASGGIDTWKNELGPTINAMLDQGFAVFAMDMPGTGESQWFLSPTGESVYAAAIETLKQRPEIDDERLGVELRSFAGHFAVKLALADENIVAAVNVGGPITFGDGVLWPLPPFMLPTLGAGFGIDQAQFANTEPGRTLLEKQLGELSLRKLGLLQPAPSQARLLTINGGRDQLVPAEEIFSLSRGGIRQEIWLYPEDGHCAGENAHEYIPASARWLQKQFDAQ